MNAHDYAKSIISVLGTSCQQKIRQSNEREKLTIRNNSFPNDHCACYAIPVRTNSKLATTFNSYPKELNLRNLLSESNSTPQKKTYLPVQRQDFC